jgi:hypothetical protein
MEYVNGEEHTVGAAAHGRAADERAIAPLIRFLRDYDVETRRTAAVALGQFADDRAIAALSEAIGREWDVEARRCAVAGLGHADNIAVIPTLIIALSDRAETVRDTAAEALGVVGPIAVPTLLDILRHHNQRLTMREGAAMALGRIADASAIAPLIDILRSPEYLTLRRAAVGALGDIAERRPAPELRNALPILRRVGEPPYGLYQQPGDPAQGLYHRVIRQIEAATATVRDLPLPASRPALNADGLPVPAQSPTLSAECLPLPADSPADAPALGSWTNTLRGFLRKCFSPRRSAE